MCEIIVLDIRVSLGETEETIHPVVLQDANSLVLVDCGYPGSLPKIEQAMEEKGLSCNRLTHVLITHHDHDHVGALSALNRKYPQIQLAAGAKEAPYLDGTSKSLRLAQAEAMQPQLPPEQQDFGLAFCALLRGIAPVPVDLRLREGDLLPWCGGCTVLETPGHTPGHISLYVPQKKTLITGDAAVLENGSLVVANPQFALDLREAEASLEKIMALGAERIICYHGGAWIRA